MGNGTNDLTEVKTELRQIRSLIQGDPFAEEENRRKGILGRLQTMEEALWGPPGRPNGIVGIVKESRVIWRTIIVGIVVTVGGAVAVKGLPF